MISMNLVGMEDVSQNIGILSAVMRDKVIKKAIRACSTPIAEAAQAGCPVDLGTLRDSIFVAITSKGARGEWIRSYIGPRTGVKVPVRVMGHGSFKGQLRIAIPTRYAHLIEFGHNVVVHGKVVGTVAPVPFMRGAWDSDGGETALNVFELVCAKEFDEAVARLPDNAFKGAV